jgi:hypothetical protein
MTLREEFHAATVGCWRTYAGSAEFWEDLRADWELEKRHPTPAAIRRGLVSGRPVPEWAADYIASRLAGTVKLPRGRPTWSDAGLTFGEAAERGLTTYFRQVWRTVLVRRVARLKREFEHPDYARDYKRKHGRLPPQEGGAYRKALNQVSKEACVSAETLRNWYYHPRRF